MVSAGFHPQVGGAERQALALSRALRALGHEVTVLTRRLPGTAARAEVEGVPVLRVRVRGSGVLDGLGFMAGVVAHILLRRGRYEAVHVHMASSPAVAASFAGRLTGLPVVVKLAGGPPYGEFSTRARGVLGRLKWAALRALRPTLVAVSPEALAEVAASGEGHRAVFVPNGVDLSAFSPAPEGERAGLRRRLGWDRVVFLHVGRLSMDARQGDALGGFLEAWARARKAGVQAWFAVAGSGPEEGRLQARSRALGVADSVLFMGPRPDVADLYRAADVFALPSLSHGLSNALLEAMATGLPVLVSTSPGVGGPVAQGREGFLFDLGRPEEGASRIAELAADEALRGALGARAREAAQAYSIESVAGRYLGLYLGGPGG